jgi:pSer/pThr/pTyr-binding forkhead associated (FHA) protein
MEMQITHMADETQESLWDLPPTDHWQRDRLGLCELVVTAPPGFALPKDKTIAISVIGGSSKGLTRRLVKPHVSIGRSGGGADIQVDDEQVSDMHCAVGVKGDIIRLCDLDSHTGTFVEKQRVSAAPLEHFSEFRIGSSVLLLTVLAAQGVVTLDNHGHFETEKERT